MLTITTGRGIPALTRGRGKGEHNGIAVFGTGIIRFHSVIPHLGGPQSYCTRHLHPVIQNVIANGPSNIRYRQGKSGIRRSQRHRKITDFIGKLRVQCRGRYTRP